MFQSCRQQALDPKAAWIPILPLLGSQRCSYLKLEQNKCLGAKGNRMCMQGLRVFRWVSLQVRTMRLQGKAKMALLNILQFWLYSTANMEPFGAAIRALSNANLILQLLLATSPISRWHPTPAQACLCHGAPCWLPPNSKSPGDLWEPEMVSRKRVQKKGIPVKDPCQWPWPSKIPFPSPDPLPGAGKRSHC